MTALPTIQLSPPLILRLERGAELTQEDRALLTGLLDGPARRFEAEQDIVRMGDRRSVLHLVTEGFAFRYKLMPEGRRQILGLLLPGDFCDVQAWLLGRADHYIAALTPCAVAEVPHRAVEALLFERPRISRALWWSTLVDESILREWLASMGQRGADRRLAHLFCELLMRLEVVGLATRSAGPMPMTQAKIADLLGITSIHVSRTLQDLRGSGLVVLRDRHLEIPDIARLWAFCDFDPGYLHLERPADGSDVG